jgi:hypothetical protein
LSAWKAGAEQEAAERIGQTKGRSSARSHKQTVAALKREHKLRDDLYRDLLKSPPERMSLPRFTSRTAKFAHSEIIVRRIDDKSYPNIDDAPGISGWFKLEILDFYDGGLACILDIKYVLLDRETRAWSLLTERQSKLSFPPRFSLAKVFVTGNIPWRNILYYDMSGDGCYPQPHVYCQFADKGEPYEGRSFFLIGEGEGYQRELQPEIRVELDALLMLAEPISTS